jgi:group I intron endonuclease
MIKSGVYRIDLGKGWFYIGSSQDLAKRDREHRRTMQNGNHFNKIVQRAFDKYGQYVFTVLERYPLEEIIGQEQILLDKYRSNAKCANIAAVAGAPMTGRKFSPEHRAAISAAKTGKTPSPEHRAALSAAGTGKKRPPRSPEWCAALSAREFSPEIRARMKGASNAGRKMPPRTIEHRANMSAAVKAYWARRRVAESTP